MENMASVSSGLMKDYIHETNLNSVEENGQTTDLYKIRVHFNDSHYDLCIAIGDIKSLDKIEYKYVYVVKYENVVSKLGLYEFVRGGNTTEYKEGTMLIFDNFMNKLKLEQMVQTKHEYILSKDFKMLIQIKKKINKDKKPFEQKYKQLFEILKKKYTKDYDLLVSTFRFYDTNGVVDFIQDKTIINYDLINEYKSKYTNMTYNDFLRMIFADPLVLLEELYSFDEKNSLETNIVKPKLQPEQDAKEEGEEESVNEEEGEEENVNEGKGDKNNKDVIEEGNEEEGEEENVNEGKGDKNNKDVIEEGEEENVNDVEEEENEVEEENNKNENEEENANEEDENNKDVNEEEGDEGKGDENNKDSNKQGEENIKYANENFNSVKSNGSFIVSSNSNSNQSGGKMKLLKRKMKL